MCFYDTMNCQINYSIPTCYLLSYDRSRLHKVHLFGQNVENQINHVEFQWNVWFLSATPAMRYKDSFNEK